MSIKITIEQTTTHTGQETKNFIVSKTPTDLRGKENDYAGEKPLYVETYATEKVDVAKSVTFKLLEQTIESDVDFDIAAVIRAVNKL